MNSYHSLLTKIQGGSPEEGLKSLAVAELVPYPLSQASGHHGVSLPPLKPLYYHISSRRGAERHRVNYVYADSSATSRNHFFLFNSPLSSY